MLIGAANELYCGQSSVNLGSLWIQENLKIPQNQFQFQLFCSQINSFTEQAPRIPGFSLRTSYLKWEGGNFSANISCETHVFGDFLGDYSWCYTASTWLSKWTLPQGTDILQNLKYVKRETGKKKLSEGRNSMEVMGTAEIKQTTGDSRHRNKQTKLLKVTCGLWVLQSIKSINDFCKERKLF